MIGRIVWIVGVAPAGFCASRCALWASVYNLWMIRVVVRGRGGRYSKATG